MTDLNSNRGPIGTSNCSPTPDDGTSAVCQHRAPVPRGRLEDLFFLEDERPGFIFAKPDENETLIGAASLDAARFVIGMELRHRAGVHVYGEGTQSGSDSGDFSGAQINKMSQGAKVKNSAGKAPINCTELPLQAVTEYFESLGKPDLGTQIVKASRDTRGPTIGGGLPAVESARLTGLIKELHDSGGFETVYLGQSVAPRLQGFAEVNRYKHYPTYAHAVRGADSKHVIRDVRAPIDKAVVRYGNKKQRVEYEMFVQKLARTKFAIGTVSAGLHGFVIADGNVYQVHWTATSKSTHLFQQSSVRVFLRTWSDAIVAIPTKVP